MLDCKLGVTIILFIEMTIAKKETNITKRMTMPSETARPIRRSGILQRYDEQLSTAIISVGRRRHLFENFID